LLFKCVGYYSGLTTLLLFSIPKTAVRFGVKNYTNKNIFTKKSRVSTLLGAITAGVVEATAVVTPAETIKTKLIHDQTSKAPKYRGVFHGIFGIARQQGLHGLYRGLLPTILRQGSN